MANEIKLFQSPLFVQVRTVIVNGQVMFAASDVAKCLGYSNPRDAVGKHCKSDGVAFCDIIDSMNRKQSAKFISKGNLIRLVANSELPQAESVESWIFDEVIPQVLETGSYSLSVPSYQIEDPIKRAERWIEEAKETQRLSLENKKLEEEKQTIIEETKPAVVFTQAVQASSASCLIGELAKLITQNGYQIGEKKLFHWMRENGYLGKHGDRYNIPNQRYVEQGLFELKKGIRTGNGGVMHTTITTKVTGKGQVYFINKFMKLKEAA